MNFAELQALQDEADFLRQSVRPLEEAFGRELPAIEAAIKERVRLRLATGKLSRPGFAVQSGSIVMEPCVCLNVYVPDTPAGAYLQAVRLRFTYDAARKQWLVWVDDTGESGLGPRGRTRREVLSLLLRVEPPSQWPPRYLWWQGLGDNAKVVDAVIDALSGIDGPSELSFDSEVREGPKGRLFVKILLWTTAVILPFILFPALWGSVSKSTLELLGLVYWVAISGTAGWQIGRHKGYSSSELVRAILPCIIFPVWGLLELAFEKKRKPRQAVR